uniref:Uncharacterized protein AlNc14C2G351 n=1 Tax=Albugo laibachii Nc14 TaxID=890382 RepID=F0VZL3_9STRA|nr:conserved hypothetical protein [Albugo laibachii Nc14]|eukprot:CCA14243.1 conserved hypothetical protein [Albugo laibachii Nc14]
MRHVLKSGIALECISIWHLWQGCENDKSHLIDEEITDIAPVWILFLGFIITSEFVAHRINLFWLFLAVIQPGTSYIENWNAQLYIGENCNFLLVCIGILDALDQIQDRLHFSIRLIKKLRRKLIELMDFNTLSPKCKRFSSSHVERGKVGQSTSQKLGECDLKEASGLIHSLLSVTKTLSQVVISTAVGACHSMCTLIMNVTGLRLACNLLHRLYQLIEEILDLATPSQIAPESGLFRANSQKRSNYEDSSLTAIVLDYREKECALPWNNNRRIQRVMHFQIPLRSFEATVRLPPEAMSTDAMFTESGRDNWGQRRQSSSDCVASSSSPRSIPVSPIARKRVQLAFNNFSDDVLYQARDRLRKERAETLTGARHLKVPRFNIRDCNEELYLTCGRHCVFKVGSGMYRSVRGSVAVPHNRYVYFEMTLCGLHNAEARRQSQRTNDSMPSTSTFPGRWAKTTEDETQEVSVCIGLSTRMMPLNTLVGTSKHSIGYYSAGHVLVGGEKQGFQAVNVRYGLNTTVGMLIYFDDNLQNSSCHHDNQDSQRSSDANGCVKARFSVSGLAVRDGENQVVECSFGIPSESDLYPTLSLHSQDVCVFSRFSAPDIIALNVRDFDVPHGPLSIWCLDGLQLDVSSNRSADRKEQALTQE